MFPEKFLVIAASGMFQPPGRPPHEDSASDVAVNRAEPVGWPLKESSGTVGCVNCGCRAGRCHDTPAALAVAESLMNPIPELPHMPPGCQLDPAKDVPIACVVFSFPFPTAKLENRLRL